MQSSVRTADGSSTFFLVDWHLLDGCNHECSYNHEPPSALQERYPREPLLEAAYRILSWRHPACIFHFYGGEPTIHPHFPELFRYVATAGDHVRIVLDTNGLRSQAYYTDLLRGIPEKRLCCNIDVHLKYMELTQLLPLMAFLAEKGHYCRLVINHVPEYTSKAQIFYEKLLAFRRHIAFALEIRLPLGGDPALAQKAFQAFEQAGSGFALPHWALTARMPQAAPRHAGSDARPFCCLGATSIHVTPDGRCTAGLLREETDTYPGIMKQPLMRPNFPPLPSFALRPAAEAWLQDVQRTALQQELNGGAVRHPLHTGLDAEQRLRQSLKRASVPAAAVAPLLAEVWQDRRKDILQIWEALEDEKEQELFAGCLKAALLAGSPRAAASLEAVQLLPAEQETSAPAGLELAEQLVFVDDAEDLEEENLPPTENNTASTASDSVLDVPETSCSDEEISEEESASASVATIAANLAATLTEDDTCIHLPAHVTQEEITALLPRLQWFKPDILLPLASSDWLSCVQLLQQALPEYALHFQEEGGTMHVLGQSRAPRTRRAPLPPRCQDGSPLLSVILPAGQDEEALARSLESALAQDVPHLEILVILDSNSGPAAATADSFARKAPWQVRPFRFDEELSMQGAWNAGLDLAQGEYACLLPCGDVFHDNALREGMQTLEREQADMASFSPDAPQVQRLDGTLARTRFLTGQFGNAGLPQKLYATRLLRAHALQASPEGGDLDDSFTLQILQLAQKVLVLPGSLLVRADAPEMEDAPAQVRAFLAEMELAVRFRAAHDLEEDDPLWAAWVRRRFQQLYPALQECMADAEAHDDILSDTRLALLARLPGLLEALVSRLPGSGSAAHTPPALLPQPECQPYRNAPAASPALSLIVNVQATPTEVFFERLQELDSTQVECVLLANGCDAATQHQLEDLADMYPHCRLFRMASPVHPAQSFACGLAQVQGQGVLFLDAHAELLPDFIPEAVRQLSANTADICAFAVRRMDADGMLNFSFFNEDVTTGAQLAAFLLEKDMPLDLAGLVFRRDFLQTLDISATAPRWQESLLLSALATARAVMHTEAALCVYEGTAQPETAVSLPEATHYFSLWQNLLASGDDWPENARAALSEHLQTAVREFWLPVWQETACDAQQIPSCLVRALLLQAASCI